MSHTIKFSVHRNPMKDADGKDTFQVRHETNYTAMKADFMEHIKQHHSMRPEVMEMALAVLEDEIREFLLDNKRLHIEGLGTFFLRIGLKPVVDDDGNAQKPRITDPAAINGHDVCIESVGFTPDKAFLSHLGQAVGFENVSGRGIVGHSAIYDEQGVRRRLEAYLNDHDYITCSLMQQEFGLTYYMARKWLVSFSEGPKAFLRRSKLGSSIIFQRR